MHSYIITITDDGLDCDGHDMNWSYATAKSIPIAVMLAQTGLYCIHTTDLYYTIVRQIQLLYNRHSQLPTLDPFLCQPYKWFLDLKDDHVFLCINLTLQKISSLSWHHQSMTYLWSS